MTVNFGQTPGEPPAAQPRVGPGNHGFSKHFHTLREKAETELGQDVAQFREKGSVKKGLMRTLHKTFLRPRGWLELASLTVMPFPVFQVKHFLEGLTGYNSLFMKRTLKGPIEMGMIKSGAINDQPLLKALSESKKA